MTAVFFQKGKHNAAGELKAVALNQMQVRINVSVELLNNRGLCVDFLILSQDLIPLMDQSRGNISLGMEIKIHSTYR